MNNKKAILKLIGIIFIGVVLKVIQLPFLEDPLAKVFHLRMIKNVATTPFALILIILSYLFFSIIFIKIQGRINGNKIYKGLIYGTLFGLLWFFGVIEMGIIHSNSIKQDILYGLGDALPLIVMGILLGMFFGSSSKNQVSKKDVMPIIGITLIYSVGRYISYIVIGAQSSYIVKPIETLALTLVNGLLISILYYFVKDALQHYRLVKRAFVFGFIIFGIDWFLYNLFIPLIYDISLLQTVQSFLGRSIPDVLYACIGVFYSEKVRVSKNNKLEFRK
ncbi:hypothetical protein [Paenibacillus medicaginis]|uniref:Uncharacterized protein n=1 Tax=Paenibacillus medicaginis TaxID=1470560 RepID=A0ABV5C162_9BACL